MFFYDILTRYNASCDAIGLLRLTAYYANIELRNKIYDAFTLNKSTLYECWRSKTNYISAQSRFKSTMVLRNYSPKEVLKTFHALSQ